MGPSTTYQQQMHWLATLDRDINPCNAALLDLQTKIQEWQTSGDHAIIMTNFNNNAMAAPAQLWASCLGAVSFLHQESVPSPTFQYGLHPVDGIFVSPELLTNAQGSYLGFRKAIASDHRAVWLDLDLPQLSPMAGEAYIWPMARRLQCKDPQIIAKYNGHLWSQLQKHDIPIRLTQVVSTIHHGFLSHNQCKVLDMIDQEVTMAHQVAEQQCRKFRSGQVLWCPLVTQAINQILYWKGVMKWINGSYIGTTILCTWAKKTGLCHGMHQLQLLLVVIQTKIKSAYHRFHWLKEQVDHRETWIAQIIAAQAVATNCTKKHFGNNYGLPSKYRKQLKM